MNEELSALATNRTWTLVPYRPDMNVVGCKWVYKAKLKPDGSLERLKARLVAKGFSQVDGVDFSETFSPVIKPASILLALTIAAVKGWEIRQLDVKNAFLHGYLSQPVYMQQPPGYVDSQFPTHVCQLSRALYGLKQAPRAWFDRLSEFLLALGFYCSTTDPSLFICHSQDGILILLLYVDDMVVTGDNPSRITWLISTLASEFSIKDLGFLHHFLGIEVHRLPMGLFLSQHRYALDLLERASMSSCKPMSTPMPSKGRQLPTCDELYPDPTHYRSIVGGLQYLTFTRPDISYSVNFVCQYMHAPTMAHYKIVKRILRYVRGTAHFGMRILASSTLDLYAFSDADWAGCPTSRRSTTGFCTFLGGNCISWSAKKQSTVARSSAEAEYRSMASTAAEITWLSFLLRDLGIPLSHPPILHCDNLSALHMTINPVFHGRTKHIELDYHFVREKVAFGSLETCFVSSTSQLADIFTKPLPKASFLLL